jgi:hypothetical protein
VRSGKPPDGNMRGRVQIGSRAIAGMWCEGVAVAVGRRPEPPDAAGYADHEEGLHGTFEHGHVA